MLHIKPRLACHQHRAAGDADRSAVGTETIILPETQATPDESIEMGSIDRGIAPRGNRVGSLIVGEKQDDVRPLPARRARLR